MKNLCCIALTLLVLGIGANVAQAAKDDNAWGGHSDAADWDRHLGHISILYDMLLPYILTRPSALYQNGYPADFRNTWPIGEGCFETPWVWAHTEFTPQQTMRGKMALYGYLYGIDHGSPGSPDGSNPPDGDEDNNGDSDNGDSPVVHFFPVANPNHENDQLIVVEVTDDAVVTDAVLPEFTERTLEGSAMGTGVLGRTYSLPKEPENPLLLFPIDFLQLTDSGGVEFNRPSQGRAPHHRCLRWAGGPRAERWPDSSPPDRPNGPR